MAAVDGSPIALGLDPVQSGGTSTTAVSPGSPILSVGDEPTDLFPPVVTLLSPPAIGEFPGASRAERRQVPVRVRIVDILPGLRHVFVIVTYAGDPHVYVAYDSSQAAGDGFVAEFLSSKRDVVEVSDTDLEVQLWPSGGWPADPRIRVVAFDQAGNVELAP